MARSFLWSELHLGFVGIRVQGFGTPHILPVYAALSPSRIFFLNLSTSSRRYIRYELIGCRLAGNFPLSSQRRSVGRLTARSRAAAAMVMRSAGSGFLRRRTEIGYPTLITIATSA